MNDETSKSSTARDLSEAALRRVVRNEALTHPATLYPGVLGALGGLAGALFGSPAFILLGLGMMVIGTGSLIVNYCFRDTVLAERYVRALNERFAREERGRLLAIRQDLESCADVSGAEDFVAQALNQFDQIGEKYQRLQSLLEEIPEGPEFTGRLSFTGEQVHLSVLDNLRAVAAALKSASTIDADEIGRRLDAFDSIQEPSEADVRESKTLSKRLRVRSEQLRKADTLLTTNEEAITEFDATIATIVSTGDSNHRLAEVGPETSLNRMRELAERLAEPERETGL